MGSNKIIFEYSIFILQIFTIFPFLMFHFTYQVLENEKRQSYNHFFWEADCDT